jgi:hypothetical protein
VDIIGAPPVFHASHVDMPEAEEVVEEEDEIFTAETDRDIQAVTSGLVSIHYKNFENQIQMILFWI